MARSMEALLRAAPNRRPAASGPTEDPGVYGRLVTAAGRRPLGLSASWPTGRHFRFRRRQQEEMAAAAAAAGEEDWVLPSEVEVLESIYLDELQVVQGNGRSSPWEICITLHPATAEDQDSQFVCFTLVLLVPAQYPNEVPKISIRNPRGLSDEQIHKISQALSCVAEAGLGTAVLYELIEKGKEILTDNNIPHGQCVICLYGFQEKEAFTKTPCYHYFHCHCLARYIQHMEQELLAQKEEQQQHPGSPVEQGVGVQCPVCRELLVYDLDTLQAAPPPQHPLEPYQPDAESLRQQEERRRLYERQQQRGGIIDPEAERNRYFISLQQPSPVEPEVALDASKGSQPPGAPATALPTPQDSLPAAPQHTRERISGAGPSQQGPNELQRAERDTSRACRTPGQQSEQRDLRGSGNSAPKGSSCTQELPPPEGPFKEPTDLKPEPQSQRVEGPTKEKGAGGWQGAPNRRNWECGRWERSKGRPPGSSYPRLPRGRGAYRPSARREPPGLEPEEGS
ncbi:E3 ubiquitin-protein ligase RNF25 [Dromiciops gliroides]|uniref:E3 ubiquitin-protein ligase RNF25 n=1 Tax=Dromiciops gliroides TaxID=33562 RepID=UPI001CC43434|nr:E3 ubiquitin-protein ligase RNF25 [Dromiciops gliroides]